MGFPGGSSAKEAACQKKERKNRLPMQETQDTWVRPLGQKDPLEEGMVTHSSIHAWRTMDRGAWWATVYKVAESRL